VHTFSSLNYEPLPKLGPLPESGAGGKACSVGQFHLS